MHDLFQDEFDFSSKEVVDRAPGIGSGPGPDPTESIDWGEALSREVDRCRQSSSRQTPPAPTRSHPDHACGRPTPTYKPPTSNYDSSNYGAPRLTDDKIREFIEAKCWVNGIYLDSLDTEYLVNCKKFALNRLYSRWYWKYFLNLVNEEILNRDVAIGPKRYFPGTENIPRRGDFYSSHGRNYPSTRK